uniref:SCAN box domain-containing protein n=1 Tax=Laticauda laticaudata TaxID=8630 RepID=A0A8C5S5Q5_LATLA
MRKAKLQKEKRDLRQRPEIKMEDREDYWKVKSAVLHREAVFREKQRQKFRRFCFQEAEGPQQVLTRLQELFCQWLQVERSSKEQILELLLLEQFLNILPREMQNWVKERTPDTCLEAVGLAEEFLRRLQTAEKSGEQVRKVRGRLMTLLSELRWFKCRPAGYFC